MSTHDHDDDPYRPPTDGPRGSPTGPPTGQPYFSPDSGTELVGPTEGGSRGWGIAVGIITPLLLPVLVGGLGSLLFVGGGESGIAIGLMSALSALPLLLLVAAVVLATMQRTRRFGVGVLMGMGIVLVVAAGACVALFASLGGLAG